MVLQQEFMEILLLLAVLAQMEIALAGEVEVVVVDPLLPHQQMEALEEMVEATVVEVAAVE